MIKRLFIVAMLTGFAHLINLISLKFISSYANEDTIAFIGELDSLILLIVSVTAFGLQLSTTRELAIESLNWKGIYYATQSARVTLSICLFILGATGFLFTKNYTFFIAPVIALNADYALYGRGKPVLGAIVAFIRVLIPSLTLIIGSMFFLEILPFLFGVSMMLAYLIGGVIVSRILKVSYFIAPRLNNLIKYIQNLKIGLANLAYFFAGIGILNVMSYLNSEESISVAYMALKLYMIFIGVRRIIVQSFLKELIELNQAIKVDYLSIVAGLIFFCSFFFYPKTIITLFLDESYVEYSQTFIIVGLAGLVSSVTSSSGARLLLLKMDKSYSYNFVMAGLIAVVSGVLFSLFGGDSSDLIVTSCLIGEVVISISNILSLKEKGYLLNRLKIISPVILMTVLFYFMKLGFEESIWTFSCSIVLFLLFVLLHSKRVLSF